jgi:anti-anti-sigma regulatory factor
MVNRSSKIELGEKLDIAGAAKLQSKLLKSLTRGIDVEIGAQKVLSVDTAALQLLLAFVTEVRKEQHIVKWRNPSEALSSAAISAGMANEMGFTD